MLYAVAGLMWPLLLMVQAIVAIQAAPTLKGWWWMAGQGAHRTGMTVVAVGAFLWSVGALVRGLHIVEVGAGLVFIGAGGRMMFAAQNGARGWQTALTVVSWAQIVVSGLGLASLVTAMSLVNQMRGERGGGDP